MGPVCALFQIAKALSNEGGHNHKSFAKKVLEEHGLDLDDDTARTLWNEAGKRNVETDLQASSGLRAAQRELAKEMADATLSTAGEFAAALYRAGLLASARPAQASLVGNAVGYAMNQISKIPGAVLDVAVSKVTGMRTVSTKGSLEGVASTLNFKTAAEMAETLAKGEDRMNLEKYGVGDGKELNYRPFGTEPEGIKKKLDEFTAPVIKATSWYINRVFSALQAADVPGQKAYLTKALQENAYVKALNEGKRGAEAVKRAEELIGAHDPGVLLNATSDFFDNLPDAAAIKEIVLESREDVDIGLLRNTNEATKVASTLSRIPVAGTLFLPFPKIPTNATLQALEWSPIGALYGGKELIKAIGGGPDAGLHQKRAVLALGKSLTSGGMILLGYQLYKMGFATPPNPVSQTDRDRNDAVGKTGASVRIGDRFYSIRDVPQLAPLAMGAMLAEMDASKKEGSLTERVARATTQSVGRNILDLPTMKSAQDALRTAQMTQRNEIPGDMAEKVLNSPIISGIGGSLVPSGLADFMTKSDPIQRDARTFKEKLYSDLPYLRNQLPPRYDALGKPMERNAGGMGQVRGLSPDQGERLSDPIRQEIERLRIPLSTTKRVTDKKDPGYDKTTQDYAAKAEQVGTAQYEAAKGLIESEWYKTASDKDRAEILTKTMSRARLSSLRSVRKARTSPSQ